ncbi:MAG: hypothetical protein ABIS03_08115 [Gemmatimonadaceae bacterium]
MNYTRLAASAAMGAFITACAPVPAHVAYDMRPAPSPVPIPASTTAVTESYSAVTGDAVAILGCNADPNLPVCLISPPSADEVAAFHQEGERLVGHNDARCQKLGQAILESELEVRMYPRALVRTIAGSRLYGVGHAYSIGRVWMVRVARRFDDLNERTMDEKLRTLRHEMSHTIGAPENEGPDWNAEDYAERCG